MLAKMRSLLQLATEKRTFVRALKFVLSEKHTKFEKIFLMVLTNQRQNHEEDFFQIMCASQKVRTSIVDDIYLYHPFKGLKLDN